MLSIKFQIKYISCVEQEVITRDGLQTRYSSSLLIL